MFQWTLRIVGVAALMVCPAWLLAAAPLQVATFTSDVTLPMGHMIYSKPMTTVEHPLMVKGIVLDDGQRRYVLCAVDWCVLRNLAHDMFQRKVAAAVGTERDCVAIQCVHQHTAPSVDGDAQLLLDPTPNPPQHLDLKFLDAATDRLAAVAKESLGRLLPFDRVGTGEAKVERVASCRRVITPEGKVLTRWSACKDPALRAMPEGRIDPFLKTITLAQGDKPLVRLHYYATHPQSFYGDGRASYDVPGLARERLEQTEHVFQIYFTGCAGDVTMGKYNDGSPEARQELADRLLAGMQAAIAATRFAAVDRLQWQTVAVTLTPRTDGDRAADVNRAKLADPKADPSARVQAASRIACAERLKQPIVLSALTLGPARIVHLPGEPMIEFQLFAQQSKPKAFVAVAGYGLGTPGYICRQNAFDEGGYEPSASAVVPRSEQVLKAAIGQLLGGD